LRPIRQECDAYFDTGDLIKAGNLAIPLKPDPAWPLLASLDCTASVIGNRETHVQAAAFKAKLAGHQHPVLCANLRPELLPGSIVVDIEGTRVGIFGVSVAMVTERMASRHVSAYVWDDPLRVGVALAKQMADEVDVLIALTHIGLRRDHELAEAAPEIHIIFGGHSHNVLEQPEQHGSTWICQGGSHGRFYGLYDFDLPTRQLTGGLHPWPS
jgi:2',3'-cyclic-nucleotide 2'-phosphodiesterase (5'-nucleotidase family)